MGFIKAVTVIVAGCALSGPPVAAQDLCPAGPFETDVHAIAAAISAHPLKPRVWEASAEFGKEPAQLSDGIWSYGAGGLASPYGRSTSYDAKRYVLVDVNGQWPGPGRRGDPAGPEALPNQVVHRIGRATYTTTVTRPTPDQARKFACLANRLVAPPFKERSSTPVHSPANPEPLPGSALSTQSQNCSSIGASGDSSDPDGHEESFEFLSGGSVVHYNTELPCATRAALLGRMNQLTEDWLDEATARAKGTWRAPRVADLAVDAADNLYLLLNPGSLSHPDFDILKLAPSGDMTRLEAPTPAYGAPYADTFTVDGQGHAWVPVPGSPFWTESHEPETWLYEIGPHSIPIYVDGGNTPRVPEPTLFHKPLDSIAISASGYHLYAMSGVDILEIMMPGDESSHGGNIIHSGVVNSVFNIAQWTKTGWFSHPLSHIAAAADGTLFVSGADAILKVSPEKVVTVLAGIPGKSGAADGLGSAARFNSPKGLALDRQGSLYIADTENQTIRRVTSGGQVSTLVGKPGKRGTVDGQGETVRLDRPASIAIDSTGTLYVTNGEDNLIRKISSTGAVTTLNVRQFIDVP
jgi:hypothetical protein